jgi:hypothetical protein
MIHNEVKMDSVVQENSNYSKSIIVFTRKNRISANNVTIYRILYEYILWILGGKPNEHKYEGM